jgi:hypothetical protein
VEELVGDDGDLEALATQQAEQRVDAHRLGHEARVRDEAGIVRSSGTVVFDAALRPDELWDRATVRVPGDGDYETVGGFVTEQLDRLPEVGDEVELEGGTLRVERVVGQRLERLRFVPSPAELPTASGAPAGATDTAHAVEPAPTDHDRVVAGLREDLKR